MERIWKYDFSFMSKICLAPFDTFTKLSDAEVIEVDGRRAIYVNRGANLLAVCHLDSVIAHSRANHFEVYEKTFPENSNPYGDSALVFNAQLDDRLGAYVLIGILDRFYRGMFDLLLCDDEESGKSTASLFPAVNKKKYNWMVEFDRKGDDVVTYRYTSAKWQAALQEVGFKIGHGSYSDISMLEDLGCCGVNIGVGYDDYHSVDARADLEILANNINKFLKFVDQYKDTHFEHVPSPVVIPARTKWAGQRHWGAQWGYDDYYDRWDYTRKNPQLPTAKPTTSYDWITKDDAKSYIMTCQPPGGMASRKVRIYYESPDGLQVCRCWSCNRVVPLADAEYYQSTPVCSTCKMLFEDVDWFDIRWVHDGGFIYQDIESPANSAWHRGHLGQSSGATRICSICGEPELVTYCEESMPICRKCNVEIVEGTDNGLPDNCKIYNKV